MRMRAGVLLLAAAVVVPSGPVYGRSSVGPRDTPEIADGMVDVRFPAADARAPEAEAAVVRLSARVPDLHVVWNGMMGTVRSVESRQGYLTRSSLDPTEVIARTWLHEHRALFALSAEAVRTLKTTRDATLPGTGTHALVFRSVYGDIPTFAGGTLGVNVNRDGRILNVWANTGPTGSLDTHPGLSAADALRAVARREGIKIQPRSAGRRDRGDRLEIFDAGGLLGPHNARLVAFPTAGGPRLAWRVFLAKDGDEMLSTAVDAQTGVLLFRSNQIDHAEGDEGRVFRNYPGAPRGGLGELVSFEGDPEASPDGWVGQAPTTAGNNIVAFTDLLWPKLAPGGAILALSQVNPIPDGMPVAPTRSFDFAWDNNWGGACKPEVLPDGSEVENPSYLDDRDPSVTNIFYFGNAIHDFAYKLGFDEEMGNFQVDNFDKGGKGLDPVRFMSMSGILNGNIDNAFMFTPADGGEPTALIDDENLTNTPAKIANHYPPFSGMFLFRPVPGFEARCSDSSQDASIAYHEYTHGVTNRVTGGPDDADALNAPQSGAMGEAWSDWFALHILHTLGLEDRAVAGGYPDNNFDVGIRNYALDRNPMTYGDYGYGNRGPEVHDDGEIWSATLWDMRTALIAKYGHTEGAARAGHLFFDGLVFQGALPSFLDARDAILRADKERYAGADTAALWEVFAKRGMGVSAKTRNAVDTDPTPAFDVPGGRGNVTISGRITDADGGALRGVRIYVGLAEGAPSPVTVTDKDGKFSFPAVRASYTISAGAPGYGIRRLGGMGSGGDFCSTICLPVCPPRCADGDFHVEVALTKNLASVGYGAKVVSGLDGDPGISLIDDHEFSGQLVEVGTPVVIELGGGKPATITTVVVAPRPQGGSTLRTPADYTVELSLDGQSWRPVARGGVERYIPSVGTTQFARRSHHLADGMKARFVRLTVKKTLYDLPTALLGGIEVQGSLPGLKAAKLSLGAPFTEEAGIGVANAGAGGDGGITETEFEATCSRPLTQGVDGWVSTFPDGFGDGVHSFATKGGDEAARDLDVFFYSDKCALTGRIATGSADEVGFIPPGTKHALIVLFAGTTNGFTVNSASTLEAVNAPAFVPEPRPPGDDLPSTGTAGREAMGIALLATAWVIRRRLGRRYSSWEPNG